MLLEGKNAVIYGGGGSIGGAVAKEFAREGANRRRSSVALGCRRSSEAGTASEISPSTPAATALALFAPEARSRTSRASKMVAIPPVIALSGARFLSKSAALTRRIQPLDPPR
jgi:3-oxoacyl-[acyl-carrier protein] reductase